MTRFTLGVQATLLLPTTDALGDAEAAAAGYGLQLGFTVGDGPTQFALGPSSGQAPVSLATVIGQVARMLGIDAVAQIAHLSSSPPWSAIFNVKIAPYLTVSVGDAPAVQLVIRLYGEDGDYGIRLGGTYGPITVEPQFTVYDLIVGYDASRSGLDVRARVAYAEQQGFALPRRAAAHTGLVRVGSEPKEAKAAIVSYPFPVPSQGGSNFQVKYVGLGQRFGPTVDIHADDPIAQMFTTLEKTFTTNDPQTLLQELVDYYDPTRDWFVAAHVAVRGWEIRAVFSDPVLYGLEITCSVDQFKGLLFEILYQKLGPHLGVYYGALTLPERYRQINLGAVALTLPSFKIWIYTNGDFKVSVGWPLGEDSIGLQVYIFTGGCGFYFGKLRSGDNPASGAAALRAIGSDAVTDVVSYNPIVTFGIAMWFGIGRSFSAGPFSASLSLTAQGTFQGLLAWREGEGRSVARSPDYFWFAATVGIVGQLQGEVDLSIVKLSVLVRLSVVAGIAFETGYGTVINVTARVDAEARLKILFITISVGFHTTLSTTFEITGGAPASLDGPRDPAFHGMNDWALHDLDHALEVHADSLRRHRTWLAGDAAGRAHAPWHAAAPTAPVDVALSFLLQPSAVYEGDTRIPVGVATLIVAAPGADASAPPSALETLATAVAAWLLRTWSNGSGRWVQVQMALGQGREPSPVEWDTALADFLGTAIRFTLNPLALDDEATAVDGDWALFPMFDRLQMTWTGNDTPLVFADRARTWPDYREVVEAYFAQLSLNALTDNPDERGALRFGLTDAEPGPGPSLTSYIFDDYFLTLCRQMAGSLADAERAGGAPGAMPDTALVRTLGGLTSRYLLNGMRLPDPATTPADPARVDLGALDIAPGYALNGQQFAFAAPADESAATVAATLSIAPAPAGPVMAIPLQFADGSSVTSSMPVPVIPPAPSPVWSRRDAVLAAAAAAVSVAAIPPVRGEAVWYAARERLPWTVVNAPSGATPGFVVPLPPAALRQSGDAPLNLTIQTGRPGTSEPPGVQVVAPAMMIQIPISLVSRPLAGSVDAKGGPANPYYTDIHRVGGTDADTRERLHALLVAAEHGALAGATVSVLHTAPTSGYLSSVIAPDVHPVLLAKTNLSTSTAPTLATMHLHRSALRMGNDALGPVSSLFPDPQQPLAPQSGQRLQDLLQLLWEVSVTQADGYFLRYADKDGVPLPVSIFTPAGQPPPTDGIPNGDSATLTVLVSFPTATLFESWHNAFVFTPQGSVDGTLFLGVADAAGVPSLQYLPSYPPGCIGFEADWSLANALLCREVGSLDSDEWIAALYHLMQFRIDGAAPNSAVPFGQSLWSLALSPTSDSSQLDTPANLRPEDFDAASQTYRQVVPAYRFTAAAGGAGPAQPYAAVGGLPNITLRVNDVFGNALEGARDTFTTPFPVTYNDALLAPMEWPGVRCAYHFEPEQLRVSVLFDPSLVIRNDAALAYACGRGLAAGEVPPDRAAQQIQAAIGRYATVLAQQLDPNTQVTLTQTVLPSNGGVLGDGAAIKQALATFASDVLGQLKAALAGGTAKAVPLTLSIPFDKTDLSNRGDDLFAVAVSLVFSRPAALVDPVARSGMPRSVSVEMPLAADLDPPPQGTRRAHLRAEALGEASGAEPIDDVGLAWFASRFEQSFAGFDGGSGAARLAVRTAAESPSSATAGVSLWAMRWSPTHGIDVSFEQGAPSYFSLVPLNTRTMGGPAQIPAYNPDTLEPSYSSQTFSGIDVDAWAQTFLSAVDELLAPAGCAALAAADSDGYATLMLQKSRLAKTLANSVEPVYLAQVGGNLAAAQDQFEQSVLSSLSTAYAVSSIVQVPATIQVAGHAEPGSVPPRFFGSLTPAAPPEGSSPACTLSSPKLPIIAGDGASPSCLSFLVTAAQAGADANLHLDLTYGARFVEHQIDAAESSFGYVPSQWLRFVLDLPADPLAIPLGPIDAPVPIRAFPPSPVLQAQQAVQTASGTGALCWNYATRLALAAQEAQDELWLGVTYNRPVTAMMRSLQGSALGTIEAVFESLASFIAAWPVLRPLVLALQHSEAGAQTGQPSPQQVISAMLDQVVAVTSAWEAWRGRTGRADGGLDSSPVIEMRTDYVLSFAHAFDSAKVIQLFARDAHAGAPCDAADIVWPAINGQSAGTVSPAGSAAPDDRPCWFMANYTYAPAANAPAGTLEIVWEALDVAARQTGYSTWWVVRNANLSDRGGLATNPALVYQTPDVSFATPVVPMITVPDSVTTPTGTLADAIEDTLAILAQATQAASKERLLRIAMSYSYQVAVADPGGESLRVDMPVLLATDVRLAHESGREAADAGISLPALAAVLATDGTAWFTALQPSTQGARLHLDVTLFANVDGNQVPIVLAPGLAFHVTRDMLEGSV